MYKLLNLLKFKLSLILSTGFGFWFNRNFYILGWYYYFTQIYCKTNQMRQNKSNNKFAIT
ncbi:hypothetical protein BpHYR1_009169 [Brachionus plicatilis]|uniref:Uncharacterized protein n=1 Tax=Brachionus plicatilis TaxID=10195 RepID=A0A3M7R6T3_BRAPC|nr:hypothetical protein BpHYR1_009169 [Brachionus plicatilis]